MVGKRQKCKGQLNANAHARARLKEDDRNASGGSTFL